MTDPLREIWKRDRRYSFEAYQFLMEALDHTVRSTGRGDGKGAGTHVSGQELLDGMRVHATKLFGPLAAAVWRAWGLKTTHDWGIIVFQLVEAKLLNRQETDRIEHFRDGFDFDEVFVRRYRPSLPAEIGTTPVSDEE